MDDLVAAPLERQREYRSGRDRPAVSNARVARSMLLVVAATLVTGCGGSGPSGGAELPRADSQSARSSAPSELGRGAASPSPSASASPTVGPGRTGGTWQLVWHDEFDGVAGSPPDPTRWAHALGDASGWGNNEREYYTDDPSNAALDGQSHLLITARKADPSLKCYYGECEYTSARLLTDGIYKLEYGRVQVRMKVPEGAGMWPAFWMLGADVGQVGWPGCGEIDIMENVGRQPNTLYATIHGPGYSGNSGLGGTILMPSPLADDYHVYAVEWEPGRITWTIDGAPYFEARPADVAPNRWVFSHEFFLLLNLAVGGSLGGAVSAGTTFPASMSVDYVRIYQLGG